ncbi:MAG: PAS domain S-box protein, partial [Bacteroidales bacterium]
MIKKPKPISRQKKQNKSVPKTIRSPKKVNKRKPVTAMFWQSSLDVVTDAVCFLDIDQRILHCNHAMTEMFGLTQKEIIGKHCWEIVHGTTKPISKCPTTRANKSFARENGEFRKGDKWFNVIVNPIVDKKGKIKGMVHTLQDITERKRTGRILQESENKYRELVENVTEVIFTVDIKGCINYISPAMEHLTGYSTNEVTGTNITEHIIPTDLPKVLASINRILVSGVKESVEYRIKIKNGEIRHVVSSSNVIFKDGQPAGLTGVITDITQRKLAENALKEAELKFRTIFDSASDGILLAEAGSRKFISANKSICKMLGHTKKDILKLNVSDIHPKESLSYVIDQFEKLSRKEIPIARNIPVMKKNKTMFFADVNSSSIVLDGKECLIGMFRDTTQRKRSEDELRESENKYKFLTETMTDIIWIMDLNLRTTYVSPSIQKVLGFSQEERLRQAVYEQLTPDSLSIANKMLEDELALEKQGKIDPQRTQTLILEFYHKDGSTRWLENTINGIRNEQGILTGLHGVSRDITERKRAEEALKERDIVFKKLSANVPGIIYQFMMKPSGTFCIPFSTEAVKDIYGCAPEDIVNDFSPILKVIHNEDTDRFIKSIEYSANNMTHWQCEYRVQVPGKPIRWLLGSSTPEKLPDGSIIWHGFNTDITERKKAEEELLLINKAMEGSSDAIAMSDPQGHHFYQNKAFSDLFEYTNAEELEAAGGASVAFTDKDTAHEVFNSIMSGRSWHGEVEMISKSGRIFPVLVRADAIKDEKGIIIGLIGIHTNITERKHAEQALLESEEKFRLLSDQSLMAIGFIQDGMFKYVNQAYCDITGYTFDEIMKWQPYEFAKVIHPDDHAFVMDQVNKKQSGAQDVITHYQFRGLTKNKETRWLDLYSRTVLYQGVPADLVSFIDITERKEIENNLRESEELFRNLFHYHAAVKLVIDPDTGNIIDANEAAVYYYGWSREQITQMKIQDINTLSPEEVKTAMEKVQTKKRISFEFRHRRADGSVRDVEIFSSKINVQGKDILHTIIHDITERKKAEEALRESESKLKAVIQGSPIPQFVIDKNHKIVYWNKAIEECSGIRAEEIIGTNRHWQAFYSVERPCLADLLLDEKIDLIPEFYQGKYNTAKYMEEGYEATDFFPILGKEGKWLFFSAAPIRDS